MMLLYVILAVFIAILILFGIFLNKNACAMPLCHIICLSGNAAAVEQQVKACLRSRENRGLTGKLLFVDKGLEPEGIMAAQFLLARETEAILCAPEQVSEYINWEIDGFGSGTD